MSWFKISRKIRLTGSMRTLISVLDSFSTEKECLFKICARNCVCWKCNKLKVRTHETSPRGENHEKHSKTPKFWISNSFVFSWKIWWNFVVKMITVSTIIQTHFAICIFRPFRKKLISPFFFSNKIKGERMEFNWWSPFRHQGALLLSYF